MRFGARGLGVSPAWFNVSRTDAAGIAMVVGAVVFLIVLIVSQRD